jgi:hypothetical protein
VEPNGSGGKTFTATYGAACTACYIFITHYPVNGGGVVTLDNEADFYGEGPGIAAPVIPVSGAADLVTSYAVTSGAIPTAAGGMSANPENSAASGSYSASEYKINASANTATNFKMSAAAYYVVGASFILNASTVPPAPSAAVSGGYLNGGGVSYTLSDNVTTDTITWSDSIGGSTIQTCTGASACTPSVATNPQTASSSQYYCANASYNGFTSPTSCVQATLSTVTAFTNCSYFAMGSSPLNLCSVTPRSGDTLVVGCAGEDNNITAMKAGSSTMTLQVGPTAPGGAAEYTSLWTLGNVSAGATQIAATTSATNIIRCVVLDVNNVPSTVTLDQKTAVTQTAYGTGSATNVTGSITTSHVHDLIIGIGTEQYNDSWTAGTGYTLAVGEGGYTSHFVMEWQAVTSTGTYDPGLQWGYSNYNDVATVALETN